MQGPILNAGPDPRTHFDIQRKATASGLRLIQIGQTGQTFRFLCFSLYVDSLIGDGFKLGHERRQAGLPARHVVGRTDRPTRIVGGGFPAR
jgi:hypothetical protein